MKKYKIQNRSHKNSHSCVPLSQRMPEKSINYHNKVNSARLSIREYVLSTLSGFTLKAYQNRQDSAWAQACCQLPWTPRWQAPRSQGELFLPVRSAWPPPAKKSLFKLTHHADTRIVYWTYFALYCSFLFPVIMGQFLRGFRSVFIIG